MQVVEKQSSSAAILGLSPGKQDRYTCICCRVKFNSVDQQRIHFKSEWHLYNLKRKVCFLEPIDEESFTQIKLNTVNDLDNESEFSSSFIHLNCKDELEVSSGDSQTLDDEDWEKINEFDLDDDELVDEDYNDEEIAELLSKMIKSDSCLFCDKKSVSTKGNISHMSQQHGFFIPEEKYLIDLNGLMEYLGFKVGASSTCLWCNKQFTSLHGVRLHMQNKDHCKILYDQERAVGEFKEFYDYSTQEQIEMKPVSELILAAGKPRQRRRSETDSSRSPGKHRSSFLRQQQQIAVQQQQPGLVAESNRSKRYIKRFNSIRAKNLLRVSLIHNQTLRGRMKHQNPI